MGPIIMEEEPDIWYVLTTEGLNITYSEVMAMDKTERLIAYSVAKEINRIRNSQKLNK